MKNNQSDYGTGIPKHEIIALAQCLLPEIRQFFDSEEGQREFEAWKMKQETLKETDENNINDERN